MAATILMWIGVGLFAGLLARLALSNVKGQPYSMNGTIGMGIMGAVLGGWIGEQTFPSTAAGLINTNSLLMAFVGAAVVVAFLRLMDKDRYISRTQ